MKLWTNSQEGIQGDRKTSRAVVAVQRYLELNHARPRSDGGSCLSDARGDCINQRLSKVFGRIKEERGKKAERTEDRNVLCR